MTETVPEAGADDAPPLRHRAEKKADKGSALWREIKGLLWVLLAVLAFHSFIAKPFYIPSESMMPGLLTGDRLVVSKYPYGWSWVVRRASTSLPPTLPFRRAGCSAGCPSAATSSSSPRPARTTDYIKRVIGLPGDTLRMVDGTLIINGKPVKREPRPPRHDPGRRQLAVRHRASTRRCYDFRVTGADGKTYLPGADRPRDPAQRPHLRHGRARPRARRTISARSRSPPATSG